MSNITGHNKSKSTTAHALRRLRFTNFRPLFTSKVLAKPPLWRRSRKLSRYINNISNFRKLAYASAASLALLTLAIITPIYLVPENSEAATGTATESSITFTSTSNTASATLDVTSVNGNFASSTSAQQIAFSLSTTNYTGYTLKLKLSDSTNTLSNGTDTLAMITNSATSDNFTNNSWGLLPSKHNSNDNADTYYPVTTAGIIMHETSGANSTANNYTIALGLKADYSKSAGTYTSNKVILEYIANPVNYVITYNKNTTDAVTNMPYGSNNNQQAGDTSATSITLSSLVPIRDGYTFKGWCSVAVADGGTCSGTTYNPDGAGTSLSYGIDQTTMNEATIYAMWEVAIKNLGNMQDFTIASCSALADKEVVELTDARDDQNYTVVKLDDHCIMTQNLNYIGGNNGSASAGAAVASNGTSFTMTSSTSSNYTAPYYYRSSNSNYGTYYNYCAASGKSVCTNSSTTGTTPATASICPSGWKLPTSPSSSSFGGISTNSLKSSGNLAVYAGYYDSGTLNGESSGGFWWSATASPYYTYGRYSLYYSASGDDPYAQYSNNRTYLLSVRCIKDDFDGYMQDMTIAKAKAMEAGDSLTLKDNRDGKIYTVEKLADGQLWMTQNLALDPTATTLNSSNTNVSSTVTTTFTNKTSSWSGDAAYTSAWFNLGSINSTATYAAGASGTGTVGGYYNYCAASAGTYCMAGGSGSGNASSSICPAGWRLPTGGSSGEFQTLRNAYRSASAFASAFHLPRSGDFWNSSANHQGSRGYWWSSTYNDGYNMHTLDADTSNVYPANSSHRYVGYSIRCILDIPTVADATYMQDVTAEMVANTDDGATASLTDSRDNQIYTVRKVGGLLWMTRNLAIGCNGSGSTYGSSTSSKTLTSSNSNVSSNWSTPTTSLTSGNDYSDPRMTCSSTYGAWYNYVAATAGTITGDSNYTEASSSICPSGWRLFTSAERVTLINNIGDVNNFNPVLGGYYVGGSIFNASSVGYWWSSTAYDSSYRRYLYYNGSSLDTGNSYGRGGGIYVRCVRP